MDGSAGKLSILFVGVGGQGILLGTRLIGEAAMAMDIPVAMSEVHGMAQRGGVVEAAVVLGRRSSPVLASAEADVMVAFEPLEALRALRVCHRESVVITNTTPIAPFTVTHGGAEYPPLSAITTSIQQAVRTFYCIDALERAKMAGSAQALNLVLVGFLTGLLSREHVPVFPTVAAMGEVLERIVPPAFLEINQRAFESGYDAAARIPESG